MSKYESSVKQIPYAVETVYEKISNLENLEQLKHRVPEDKVKDFSFDHDTVSMNVPPVGTVTLKIVSRDPNKCVKFEAVNSPAPLKMWIQVLPVTETTSKMRLTIDADIPIFVKPMVEKPLKEGLEKIADVLAMVPYGN